MMRSWLSHRPFGRALLLLGGFLLSSCQPLTHSTPVDNPAPIKAAYLNDAPTSILLNAHTRQGIEVELVKLIALELQRPIRWQPVSRSNATEALQQQQVDLVIGGFTDAIPPAETLRYSSGYLGGGQMVILHRSRLAELSPASALQQPQRRIGVLSYSAGERYALSTFPEAYIIALNQREQGYTALREGKLDLLIDDASSSWQLANNRSEPLMSLYRRLTQEQHVLLLSADRPEWIQAVDNSVERLRRNGLLERLLNHFLPVRIDVN